MFISESIASSTQYITGVMSFFHVRPAGSVVLNIHTMPPAGALFNRTVAAPSRLLVRIYPKLGIISSNRDLISTLLLEYQGLHRLSYGVSRSTSLGALPVSGLFVLYGPMCVIFLMVRAHPGCKGNFGLAFCVPGVLSETEIVG